MNTKQLTTIDKLDKVLRLLADSTQYQIEENVQIAKLDIPEIMEFFKTEHKLELSNHELNIFLIKLKNDEFIEIEYYDNDNKPRYFASFDGYLFSMGGGYYQRLLNNDSQNNRVAALEHFQKVNANRMTYLTIVIAVGTLIAAAYYSIELLKYFGVLPEHFEHL